VTNGSPITPHAGYSYLHAPPIVGQGRNIRLGNLLLIGRDEDISDAAASIGKEGSPCVVGAFDDPGEVSPGASFRPDVSRRSTS
jgi:hypothetical protein